MRRESAKGPDRDARGHRKLTRLDFAFLAHLFMDRQSRNHDARFLGLDPRQERHELFRERKLVEDRDHGVETDQGVDLDRQEGRLAKDGRDLGEQGLFHGRVVERLAQFRDDPERLFEHDRVVAFERVVDERHDLCAPPRGGRERTSPLSVSRETRNVVE